MLPIACVCIVIALVLYFFYWYRFIASLIGQAIRILYWNQERSSIWIEIGISLSNVLHSWKFDQSCRFNPFLPLGGKDSVQGRSLPFQ